MSSGLYWIKNIVSGKRYIGSALYLSKRLKNHKTMLGSGVHHSVKLQRAWNKHGAASFEFKVMLLCDPKMLLEYEQRAIDKYDVCKNGYNINPLARSRLGAKLNPKQLSAARLRYDKRKGKPSGYRHSEQAKNTLAQKATGRGHSDEARRKMSLASKGIPKHPDVVSARLGRKASDECKRKMSEARKGKKLKPRLRVAVEIV